MTDELCDILESLTLERHEEPIKNFYSINPELQHLDETLHRITTAVYTNEFDTDSDTTIKEIIQSWNERGNSTVSPSGLVNIFIAHLPMQWPVTLGLLQALISHFQLDALLEGDFQLKQPDGFPTVIASADSLVASTVIQIVNFRLFNSHEERLCFFKDFIKSQSKTKFLIESIQIRYVGGLMQATLGFGL